MDNTELHGAEQDWEINLMDLFYLFRQKLVGILLALILGGLAVGGGTFLLIDPTYEATAKLYIVSASNDSVVNLTDLQIGASLTADYEELVLSRPMLESVIENLELEVEDVEELEEMIEISNPADTRILNITATSTDPEEAERIANEIAALAIDWLPEIMESNTPNIAEEAVIPDKKAGPSYLLSTMAGAVVFAALYYGIAVLRYVNDDTVRTEEELERYFGLTPLAVIPEEEELDAASKRERKSRLGFHRN